MSAPQRPALMFDLLRIPAYNANHQAQKGTNLMAKRATIKEPDDFRPRDAAVWQQLFPHDLDCSMEFIKDEHGKVDVVITTTDYFHKTNRPVEIPTDGQGSQVVIQVAGYENLPDRDARSLDPTYFYQLLMRRMIYNLARFYGNGEEMLQHLAWFLDMENLLINPVNHKRWTKARKGTKRRK